MELNLYTIHVKGQELRTVTETGPLGLVPPLWALWEGLWITFVLMLAGIALVTALQPLANGIFWLALIGFAFGEGDSLARLELRLRGWREVGLVQAASAEGAEELYLRGEAVSPA